MSWRACKDLKYDSEPIFMKESRILPNPKRSNKNAKSKAAHGFTHLFNLDIFVIVKTANHAKSRNSAERQDKVVENKNFDESTCYLG